MRYYLITCRRGHMGIGRYSEISFAMSAPDMLTASNKARSMPGVQHSKPVLAAREISREEYIERRKTSAYHR